MKKILFIILFLSSSCVNSDQPQPRQDFGEWLQTEIDIRTKTGGVIHIDPGVYVYSFEPTIPYDYRWPLKIVGYGARLQPQGAMSGIVIESALGRVNSVTIEGLQVEQDNEPLAISGIMINGARNTKLINVHVFANRNVNPNWCGIILKADTDRVPDGKGAGAYWTKITNAWVRARLDPNEIPCGIRLIDRANATVITGAVLAGIYGVGIDIQETSEVMSHGVVIRDSHFENSRIPFVGHAIRFSSVFDRIRVNGFEISSVQFEKFAQDIVLSGSTFYDQRAKGFVFKDLQTDPGTTNTVRNIHDIVIGD